MLEIPQIFVSNYSNHRRLYNRVPQPLLALRDDDKFVDCKGARNTKPIAKPTKGIM